MASLVEASTSSPPDCTSSALALCFFSSTCLTTARKLVKSAGPEPGSALASASASSTACAKDSACSALRRIAFWVSISPPDLAITLARSSALSAFPKISDRRSVLPSSPPAESAILARSLRVSAFSAFSKRFVTSTEAPFKLASSADATTSARSSALSAFAKTVLRRSPSPPAFVVSVFMSVALSAF